MIMSSLLLDPLIISVHRLGYIPWLASLWPASWGEWYGGVAGQFEHIPVV